MTDTDHERASQRALSNAGYIGDVAKLIVGVCSDLSLSPYAHARRARAVAERLAVAIDTDPADTAEQLRYLVSELKQATRDAAHTGPTEETP